ncbi:hypothetical protein GYMLUDRAFT_439653 [Collybiopsis luxurians FD-317 M1]|uniref:Uncharacterized protein n=1 Tax=Collybiopsis luxurians FD-317 M1 TaxID=944289 RepID=A0A0D0BMB8_9AGAR|nr:hypothetical protein GYMLUDRAFT_439653 [Collybiopsis luxurians FD-317 M1]
MIILIGNYIKACAQAQSIQSCTRFLPTQCGRLLPLSGSISGFVRDMSCVHYRSCHRVKSSERTRRCYLYVFWGLEF